MSHTTEVVAIQKMNNGQISVCLRCCGNPSTDHWHTMAVSVASDPDKRKASIAEQHVFCAQQHESMNAAMAQLSDEIPGESLKVEHS